MIKEGEAESKPEKMDKPGTSKEIDFGAAHQNCGAPRSEGLHPNRVVANG